MESVTPAVKVTEDCWLHQLTPTNFRADKAACRAIALVLRCAHSAVKENRVISQQSN